MSQKWWTAETPKQQTLFDAARDDVKIALTVCKEGVEIGKCMGIITESTGCRIPYQEMGFQNFNHFLYHIGDILEVRELPYEKKKFLFLRDSALSEDARHMRQMVQEQANCKTNKRHPRPTIRNTKHVSSDVLLSSAPPPYRASLVTTRYSKPSTPSYSSRVSSISRFTRGGSSGGNMFRKPYTPYPSIAVTISNTARPTVVRTGAAAGCLSTSATVVSSLPAVTVKSEPYPSIAVTISKTAGPTVVRTGAAQGCLSTSAVAVKSAPYPSIAAAISNTAARPTVVRTGAAAGCLSSTSGTVVSSLPAVAVKSEPYPSIAVTISAARPAVVRTGAATGCLSTTSATVLSSLPAVAVKSEPYPSIAVTISAARPAVVRTGAVAGCLSTSATVVSSLPAVAVKLEPHEKDHVFTAATATIRSSKSPAGKIIWESCEKDREYVSGLRDVDQKEWTDKMLHAPFVCIPYVRVPLGTMKVFKLTEYTNLTSFRLAAVRKEAKTAEMLEGMHMYYNQMKTRLPEIGLDKIYRCGIYAGLDSQTGKWSRVQVDLTKGVKQDMVEAMNIDDGKSILVKRTTLRHLIPRLANLARKAFPACIYIPPGTEISAKAIRLFDRFMRNNVGKSFRVFVCAQMPDIYAGVPSLLTRLLTLVTSETQ